MDGFKRLLLFLNIPLILVWTGCAQIPIGSEVTMLPTTFPSQIEDAHLERIPEYYIQAGDTLDILFAVGAQEFGEGFKLEADHTVSIKFPQASELNQTQQILPDGTLSLPYIGVINVIGLTIPGMVKELKKRYTNILNNPDINVYVPEFRSRVKDLKKDLHTAPRGLSRLVRVRPDGYCTFPMVGDLLVAGKTIPEVHKSLNKKYRNVLPGLHVDLFLEKATGFVVYVFGNVKTPGAYPMLKPINVMQSMALAGSYLPGSRMDSVMVVRRDPKRNKIIATRVDLKSTLELKCRQKVFYLKPDDVVFVPKTWISKAADVMRDIWTITNFNGYGASFGFSYELHKEPITTDSSSAAVIESATTTATTP